MRYRAFGTTDLSVSELGVGCSRIGGVFSEGSSRADELVMLRDAIDAGINLFDTSDLYSQGESEVLVGQAIKSRRDEVVVASKGGYVVPGRSRAISRLKPMLRPVVQALGLKRRSSSGPGGPIPQDFSPTYLASAVEASLRRLGTDRIDIYQLHSPPASVVEQGDYLAALLELQAQGKIRHIGLAGDSAGDLAAFDAHRGVASLQVPFSAIDQDAAAHLLPRAAASGVGVITRSCYAAGLLVGDHDATDLRAWTPDAEAILRFQAVAAELGRSRQELALQFNLAAPGAAVTIVGMRTPDHLRANLTSLAAPPLAAEEWAALTQRGDGEPHSS